MSDDNNNYGSSDDDRYYYEHYEGKDYYDEVGRGWPRLSLDFVIYIIFILFLLILNQTSSFVSNLVY